MKTLLKHLTFWKNIWWVLHSHIIILLFIFDICFKKFAKNKFLYSIKNNSPYGIKKQKNTSTWDTEVTPSKTYSQKRPSSSFFPSFVQKLREFPLLSPQSLEDPCSSQEWKHLEDILSSCNLFHLSWCLELREMTRLEMSHVC